MTSDGPLDTPSGWHWGAGGGVLAPGIGAFVSGGVPATGSDEKKDSEKKDKDKDKDKSHGISSTSIDGLQKNVSPIMCVYPPPNSYPKFDRKSYNVINENGSGGLFGESCSLPAVGSNSATTIQASNGGGKHSKSNKIILTQNNNSFCLH